MIRHSGHKETHQILDPNEIKKIIENILLNYGFNKDGVQPILRSIEKHVSLLQAWNRVHNLTALKSEEEVYLKLVIDSLLFLKLLKKEPMLSKNINQVADFGSGAGFPGIVLAICLKGVNFTLIESNKKKSAFLKYLIAELNLRNVVVYSDRAEKYSYGIKAGTKCPFDAVLSKAAASLPALIKITRNLIKEGGILVVWSKRKEANELQDDFKIYEENEGIRLKKRVNILNEDIYPAKLDTEFLIFEKIF
ncbi:MAG: 16S rRNA (guanine(527)-N(7))-methyltransferase RsmG [Actinobacteria bacterium]|nr:16S rRNA (guanine(527)-N(7))-methyltransferase RsmG [Actinomycetota bacterium]